MPTLTVRRIRGWAFDSYKPRTVEYCKVNKEVIRRRYCPCLSAKYGVVMLYGYVYMTSTSHNLIMLFDGNQLYKAYKASVKNSKWKNSIQRQQESFLSIIYEIEQEMENHTYHTEKQKPFIINERGKKRLIYGNTLKDRIVRHAFVDDVLMPTYQPYLIYDNGASVKGKGTEFTRKRFEKHLKSYYMKHRSNEGYILIMDFSKYYDNIHHDIAMDMLKEKIDEKYYWLLEEMFDSMKVDVSYMSDEEYEHCMDVKFDSLEHTERCNNRGIKYMRKGCPIGDQLSMIVGLYYPHEIDNYIKIVRSHKYYGRYTDDSYIISESKEELLETLKGVEQICNKLGIFLNKKKTHIQRLDQPIKFLQRSYRLSDTGKLKVKILPCKVTRQRRRMKRISRKVMEGKITKTNAINACKSWMGSFKNIMSEEQISNLNRLQRELF